MAEMGGGRLRPPAGTRPKKPGSLRVNRHQSRLNQPRNITSPKCLSCSNGFVYLAIEQSSNKLSDF